MILVNNAVFATTSLSRSLVRMSFTGGSKRRRYFFNPGSQMVKPGTTAASVLTATRATPLAVEASRPKKSTNTPCPAIMFVSISTPTVFPARMAAISPRARSEEHTSELQSHSDLVCRLLLEKKNKSTDTSYQQNKKQYTR